MLPGEDLDGIEANQSSKGDYVSQEPQEKQCRICLEMQTKELPLITPCRCSGSVRYIHEECLKTWLLSNQEDIKEGECEICKTVYRMEFKLEKVCSSKQACSEGITQCMFVPLLFAVLIMLIIITFLLATEYLPNADNSNSQAYTIALILICTVSAIVIVILMVNTLKDACLTQELKEWKIFDQDYSQEVREQHDDSTVLHLGNDGHSYYGEQGIQTDILVIPKTVKFGGRKISIPNVQPQLQPLRQQGQTVGYQRRNMTPFGSISGSLSVTPRMNRSSTDLMVERSFSDNESSRRQRNNSIKISPV